jgi:hypothetical protein
LDCSSKTKVVQRDYSKGIVYVLPGTVQKLLVDRIIEDNKIYFILKKTNEMEFRIYQATYVIPNNWIKNTSRYISVGGKLYPLLFDFDDSFANTETAEEFLNDYKQGIYKRTQAGIVREHLYQIDFTFYGEILYEGFGE